MQNHSVVIIGAGIVGLATAYQLIQKNPALKITILEKEEGIARHQTGHNSGVIHSGVYYKPGSLKAQNCRRGYDLLLDFCQQNDVAYELCGKVIVATQNAELPQLDMIFERGQANGLKKIKKISGEELHEIEPHVAGIAAIKVPEAGIINYTKVSQKLADLLTRAGAEIRLNQQVTNIMAAGKTIYVDTYDQEYTADLVINCAGLYSDKVAQMTNQNLNVRIMPFRGEYFELKPEKHYLVNDLIYPVPDPNFPFLGVHFTRMIEGGIEAGPNAVLAFQREGYSKSDINLEELSETLRWPGFQKVAAKYWRTGLGEMYRSFSKSAFTRALQKLMPEIQESDLVPGGAGVRAQACDKEGGLLDDFMILESPGVINVCNAPSPAATSSLSIGLTIAEKALTHLS